MSDEYEDETERREPRKVYWTGRQWCVTDNGLETIVEGQYDIEAEALGHLTTGDEPEAERMRHTGSSHSWVDIEDFAAAFAVALAVHAGRYQPLPEGAFINALAGLRRVWWIRHHRRENGTGEGLDIMDDLMAAAEAADDHELEHPFDLVPDPHPSTYAEERRIVESWNRPKA